MASEKGTTMRIYVSKYLGHGVRVGMPVNVPSYKGHPRLVPRPPALNWVLFGCGVTGGIGFLFPPMFAGTLVLFVAALVVRTRWDTAERQARGEQSASLTPLPRRVWALWLVFAVTTGVGVVFPPLLLIALAVGVWLLVDTLRWAVSAYRVHRQRAASAAAAPTPRPALSPAEQTQAARMAELDAMIAARQAEYQRLTGDVARQQQNG